MAPPAVSAITMALNKASTPYIDIANGNQKAGFAGLTAVAKHPANGLPPTPPNSYSPYLIARTMRSGNSSSPPIPLDLDPRAHATAPATGTLPLSKEALSGLERSEVITPAMIARDHLPGIMLGHGDMAIRHIMACLNNDVSGFSKIEPARARRTVVAALESRSGSGLDGDVEFVKVGWGRWLAHTKGEKPTRAVGSSRARLSSSESDASFSTSFGSYSKRKPSHALGQSYTGSDMPSLDEGLEDMSMSDIEVENMSIDGLDVDDSASDSGGDETDEEDWAAIGADALRRRASRPITSVTASSVPRRNYNLLCIPGQVYKRRYSSTSSSNANRFNKQRIAASCPVDHFIVDSRAPTSTNINAMDIDQDAQERDAARALLSLGSM